MLRFLTIFLLSVLVVAVPGRAEPFLLTPLEPFDDEWRIEGELVASNGGGFLVVTDDSLQRFDSAGKALELPRGLDVPDVYEVIDLEWTGDHYVLLYREIEDPHPLLVRISAEGVVSGRSVRVPIEAMDLAWSGDRGLLIGPGHFNGQAAIVSVAVSSAFEVGEPRRIADVDRWSTDLVPFEGGFLLVFSVGDALAAMQLSAQGEPAGPVHGLANGGSPSAVAATGAAGTVVAIREETEWGPRVRTVPIGSDGSPGPHGMIMDRLGSVMEIVATPSGFLLLYESMEGGWDARLVARPLSGAGAADGNAREVTPLDTHRVLAASSATSVFVQYEDPAAQVVVNPDATIATGPWDASFPPAQTSPLVVFDGMRYVVAWAVSTRTGGRIESVQGTRQDELVGAPLVVTSAERVRILAMEATPAGVVLLWLEANDLHGALLAGDSWVPLHIDFSITSDLWGFGAAWDGASVVLVWSGPFGLDAARMSLQGTVTTLGTLIGKAPETAYSVKFVRPRVTADAEGFAVVAESHQTGILSDLYFASTVFVRAAKDGSVLELAQDLVPEQVLSTWGPEEPIPADVALRDGILAAVVADGETIEVFTDPAGPSSSRELIARGTARVVRIEPTPEGFMVRWLDGGRMFSVPLGPSATPNGPVRVLESTILMVDIPGLDFRWNVDVTAGRDEIFAVAAQSTPYRGLFLSRIVGEYLGEGFLHPAPDLAAPAPAWVTFLTLESVLVHWTRVPEAEGYVIQAKYKPHGWATVSTAGAHDVSAEVRVKWFPSQYAPKGIRVLAVNRGLSSAPVNAWPTESVHRRRVVRR